MLRLRPSFRLRGATAALVFVALLAASGCTPSDDSGRGGAGGSGGSGGVPWQDYAPNLQSRIDDLADAKDCTALQSEFDVADANNAATRTRTGHNSADLMTYIDGKMRSAGCY